MSAATNGVVESARLLNGAERQPSPPKTLKQRVADAVRISYESKGQTLPENIGDITTDVVSRLRLNHPDPRNDEKITGDQIDREIIAAKSGLACVSCGFVLFVLLLVAVIVLQVVAGKADKE